MRVIHVITIGWSCFGLAVPGQAVDSRAAQDHAVVAVVLEDLATYRGDDSPIDETFSPDPLTLDPTPLRYGATVKDLLEQYEPKNWRGLAAADRPRLQEAARSLVGRMKGPPTRFSAGSSRVPLYAGSDPSKLSPFQFRDAPIQASLPGYSANRRIAIIKLSIPWSIHGCTGTYVVAHDDGTWRVQVRDFACYL